MEHITKADIEREINLLREYGLDMHYSAWSPGDRDGTRYSLEMPRGVTVSRNLFGRTACFNTLNAIRRTLDSARVEKTPLPGIVGGAK